MVQAGIKMGVKKTEDHINQFLLAKNLPGRSEIWQVVKSVSEDSIKREFGKSSVAQNAVNGNAF